MTCALCWYDGTGDEPEKAITVIEGYAVCQYHMGYVAQGGNWHSIYRTLQEAAAAKTAAAEAERERKDAKEGSQ